jgi:hypothetical protein
MFLTRNRRIKRLAGKNLLSNLMFLYFVVSFHYHPEHQFNTTKTFFRYNRHTMCLYVGICKPTYLIVLNSIYVCIILRRSATVALLLKFFVQ